MNAKTLGATLLSASLLFGCTATNENFQWDSRATSEIKQSSVTLSSTMWINKMPSIGEEATAPLHGSLTLSSDSEIPANLRVVSVWVRNGSESLKIDDNFDIVVMNENQWQISFKQSSHFEGEISSLDIAIELESDNQLVWLTQQGVVVDTVY